jgi:hypothetical protein
MLGAPFGFAVGLITTALLAVLALVSIGSLRESLDARAFPGPGAPPAWARALWPCLLVAVVIVSLWPADPWRVLTGGLGLAAATLGGPLVVGGDHRARLAGALVGGVVFGLLATPAIRLPAWAGWLDVWPALVAAPLACMVVVLLRPRTGATARGR